MHTYMYLYTYIFEYMYIYIYICTLTCIYRVPLDSARMHQALSTLTQHFDLDHEIPSLVTPKSIYVKCVYICLVTYTYLYKYTYMYTHIQEFIIRVLSPKRESPPAPSPLNSKTYTLNPKMQTLQTKPETLNPQT